VQAVAYDPELPQRTRFTDGPRIADGVMVLANGPAPDAPQRRAAPTIAALIPSGDRESALRTASDWAAPAGYTVAEVTDFHDWSVVLLRQLSEISSPD
jgi:hypothetical protein